jgi:hypothetical protein
MSSLDPTRAGSTVQPFRELRIPSLFRIEILPSGPSGRPVRGGGKKRRRYTLCLATQRQRWASASA